jgi:hypothetical protein
MIEQKVEIKDNDINISFKLSQYHIDMMIDLYDKSSNIDELLYLGTWYNFTTVEDRHGARTIFNDLINCNIITLEPGENPLEPQDREVFATYTGIPIYKYFKNQDQ